jgi:hypothetical protein
VSAKPRILLVKSDVMATVEEPSRGETGDAGADDRDGKGR